MKTLILTFFILFLACVPLSLLAQHTPEEDDPFKNDPLFTKPLHEFFGGEKKGSKDDCDNHSEWRWNNLNDDGLDHDDFLDAGPYNSSALYGQYPSLPMIHFNRVDGLFLGLRQERMQWYRDNDFLGIPNINPHWMVGYSFGQNEFQYVAGLEKFIGRKKHIIIGGEYHDATSTDDYWRVGLNETTLTAFTAGYDYLDYYKQQGWGAYILLRTDRLFEGGVAFSDDRYNSLNQQSDFALFGSGGRYRPNPPIEFSNGTAVDTLNISSLTVSSSFNPKRLLLSRHFMFSLSGSVEFADPGISTSDYDYTKYLAEVVSYVNFEPGSVFKYRLRAGSITGDAPSLKEFQLGGIGSLRALPYKALPSNDLGDNQMLLSNAEIQFGAPRFGDNSWIDTNNFYIALFLDSGWTNDSAELREENNPLNGFSEFKFADLKHNGGFGVGSSLFRAELAWDLNNTDRAPVFWIRFNPTF